MLVDDVDKFLEQQEIGRDDTQARTYHDAIVSSSCECMSKCHFRGLAIVNVQRLHAVAERLQLGGVASTAARVWP